MSLGNQSAPEEELFQKLPGLLNNYAFKRDYLNHLEHTEMLERMLALPNVSLDQAVRVVKQALEVDGMLGVRLAIAVKPEFQKETVELVANLDVPDDLKAHLLGMTYSTFAAPKLIELAIHHESQAAVYALGKVTNERAIARLIELAAQGDWNAVNVLKKVDTSTGFKCYVQASTAWLKNKLISLRCSSDDVIQYLICAEIENLAKYLNKNSVEFNDRKNLVRVLLEYLLSVVLQTKNRYLLATTLRALDRARDEHDSNNVIVNAIIQLLKNEDLRLRRQFASFIKKFMVDDIDRIEWGDKRILLNISEALELLQASEQDPRLRELTNWIRFGSNDKFQ